MSGPSPQQTDIRRAQDELYLERNSSRESNKLGDAGPEAAVVSPQEEKPVGKEGFPVSPLEPLGNKRPRRGEGTIADPTTISLHHTDFIWHEMFLSDGAADASGNRALLDAYHRLVIGQLEAACAVEDVNAKTYSIPLPPTPTSVKADTMSNSGSCSPFSSAGNSLRAGQADSNPWNEHYRRNLNQFFPYKNYLVKAFPDLERIVIAAMKHKPEDEVVSSDEFDERTRRRPLIVMECGCGTGSALLPILFYSSAAAARFLACDISAKAVEMFQAHPIVQDFLARQLVDGKAISQQPVESFLAFPYNIASKFEELDAEFVGKQFLLRCSQDLPAPISPFQPRSVDILLLIFTLCAMESVADMLLALRRLHRWVRPGGWAEGGGAKRWEGGKLLFRDYGMFDHNMFRFETKGDAAGCNLSEGFIFCKKADGTSQFFFDVEFTKRLFEAAGFVCLQLDYHCNTVKNRKTGVHMHKVFVNGEFGVAAV